MRKVAMNEVHWAAKMVGAQIVEKVSSTAFLFGVPRGGIPAALAISSIYPAMTVTDDALAAHVYVDDLVDSGRTFKRFNHKPFAVLFTKQEQANAPAPYMFGSALNPKAWVVFPWEGNEQGSGEDIVIRFLQYIGEDPARGGLKETPARVLKAWREDWFSGYNKDPREVLKTFEDGSEKCDEMIVVKNIPIYTHCEHHLAPFFGEAVVAYVPNGKIVGLSKLCRLADIFARRLQVQERLTIQIADALMEHLGARGVGVIIKCRHLCMESRGVKAHRSETITSAMRGVMMENSAARSELLALLKP